MLLLARGGLRTTIATMKKPIAVMQKMIATVLNYANTSSSNLSEEDV
jgi:hypothetical protein